MDIARRFSSNKASAQDDDTNSNHPKSSSSKFSSLKKKVRSFRKKKNANRRLSLNVSGSYHSGSDILGNIEDQNVVVSPNTGDGPRDSSLPNDVETSNVLRIDKFGAIVIEDVAAETTAYAEAGYNTVDTNNNNNNCRPKKAGEHVSKKSSASVRNINLSSPSALKKMMKQITRQGLPDPSMRHRAWTVITGADAIMIKRDGEYDAFVGKSRADMHQIQEYLMGGKHRTVNGQIEKDLKRTFPHHRMMRDLSGSDNASTDFKSCRDDGQDDDHEVHGDSMDMLRQLSRMSNAREGYGKQSLRRILRAYSVYDTEVGYCQGMNFIAAMLLTFMPEEESFWTLVVVMNEDPYKLRDLFSREMALTHEALYIADKLFSQFLPNLYEHLEDEQVYIAIFVTQWLMTIFTSTFPFTLVGRVWDVFLCDGWIVVYRTMLALLMNIQEELSSRHYDQILSFLRGYPSTVNCDSIMALASTIPLNQQHIQEHALKFRNLTESGEIRVEEIPRNRFRTPESIDGLSFSSSRVTLQNINKVHRFVSKLKHSTREISVEDLGPKLVPIVGRAKLALLLSNVLSPEECDGLIKRAKGEQFEDVLMRQSRAKGNDSVDISNCRRSMVEDPDIVSELFDRLANALRGTEFEEIFLHAPWVSKGDAAALTATGLNDRLHFIRFGTGQFFAPHRDSRFKRGNEISHITMQIFLNHNFSGGMTSFKGGNRYLDVKPMTGSVLLFDQDIRREECEVFIGRKFVARSDVMFAAP